MHLSGLGAILLILLMHQLNTLEARTYSKISPAIQYISSDKMTNTILKVALYPILPDSGGDKYKSLLQFITTEFKKVAPHIILQLRPMNSSDNVYDIQLLTEWLASDGSGYDVVEIDTLVLGDLVNAGLVAPQFPIPDADWHSAAATAVQFNQVVYAFPHLMCGFFLFTRDDRLASVNTIDQLINILGNTPTDKYRLVGNLNSSWDLPALAVHSYQGSNNSTSDVAAFALHAYTNSLLESMRKLAGLCKRTDEKNHCLDGTFRTDLDLPSLLFARKQTPAMFDNSEKLFLVLKNGSPDDYNNVKVVPLPIGNILNRAVFFIDAFVFRRNMSDDVLNAARLFADFMGTPRMQAAVVGSGDTPGSIPRYLLPMSKSAYNEPLIANNRFYQQYFRNLTGVPYPTVGFSNARKQLQTAILNYIK